MIPPVEQWNAETSADADLLWSVVAVDLEIRCGVRRSEAVVNAVVELAALPVGYPLAAHCELMSVGEQSIGGLILACGGIELGVGEFAPSLQRIVGAHDKLPVV